MSDIVPHNGPLSYSREFLEAGICANIPVPPTRKSKIYWSGQSGSNRRQSPWQGGTLPLSYARNPPTQCVSGRLKSSRQHSNACSWVPKPDEIRPKLATPPRYGGNPFGVFLFKSLLERLSYFWRSDRESNPVTPKGLQISNLLHYHPAPAPRVLVFVRRGWFQPIMERCYLPASCQTRLAALFPDPCPQGNDALSGSDR